MLLLGGLALVFAGSALAGPELTPLLDLRVRQEILDGVYHFSADPHRNWLRVRSRAGLRYVAEESRFEVRLVNEHRRHIAPDQDFDWDELILDRALWAWTFSDGATLTFGRQDIIWNKGFLMLDARPYDGSRSISHDAVRLQMGPFDLAFVRNPKRDQIVLAGDQDRALRDMDETAITARGDHGGMSWVFVWKDESDPDAVLHDLTTLTFGARYDGPFADEGSWLAEAAVQHQRQKSPEDSGRDDKGTALALQAFVTDPIGWETTVEAGGFYYSGATDGDWRAFRAPWGRWPKWSELYIYTLLGESTPGRPTVAAWENITGPSVQFRRPLGGGLSARLGLNWFLAPQPDWESRGLLTQAELTAKLGKGFDGHLLWEMLVPGEFHDGRHGLPSLTETVHFLRWQIAWAL